MTHQKEKVAPAMPSKWVCTLSSLPDEAGWIRFLDELEGHLEGVYAYAEHASYLLYRDKVDPELDEVNAMARAVYRSDDLWDLVNEACATSFTPALVRRSELLRHVFLRERAKAHPEIQRLTLGLSKLYVHHRPCMADGTSGKGTLSHIMRTSSDRERRREAWYAIHNIGSQAAPIVLDLARCRTEVAKELGFSSWNDLIFPTYGLTRSFVDETIEDLGTRLRPLYDKVRNRLANDVGLDELLPWDLEWARDKVLSPSIEPFSADTAIPALDATLKRLGGQRDPGNVPITIADIPLGGACFDIHIPKDLRILVNPREGLIFRWVLFHEYGHALHHYSNRQESYTLQRGDPSALREGMADLLASYATDPSSLADSLGGIKEAETWWGRVEIRRIFDVFKQMYQATTENRMFDDDLENHDKDHLAASERFAIGIPEDAPHSWAVRITLGEHPNYMQDYMFAQMVAAQCREYLANEKVADSDVIPTVTKTLLAPGASKPWQEKIENFSGTPLKSDSLIRRFEKAYTCW